MNEWHVCIDRKDNFPLPFINQMIESLVWYIYFFFDRYGSYNKISIAPTQGLREDYIYMSIWNLLLSKDAIRVM